MSVTTYDLGTVLMVPKGDWNSTTAYERLNLVRHNGTAWLCTVAAGQTSLNEEPSSSATNWEILVQDQSSVTSVNGQRGDVTIDESNIVHKAGTEIITGDKTFTGTLTAPTPDEDDESTKVATTEWVKNTTLTNAVGGSGNNLFDVKWSDHRLNDMSWLRSDTFSWHNGEVYSAAYQELLDEYTNRSDNTIYKAFAKSNFRTTGSKIKEWRGIVQGFYQNTNYITHPVSQPTTSMEYVIKVHVSILKTTQYILGNNNTYINGPILYIANATTGQLNLYVSNNGSSWNVANNANTNCTLPVNTWKWFKLAWDGSVFTVSESIDGINYTQKYSATCTAAPRMSTDKILGVSSTSADYAFTSGKFDLQECYFKADGTTVWKGADFIEYVITDKKYRIALPSQAEKIKKSYDDYGIAWYYILDSTNTRFKLPRTKYGFMGLRNSVGKFIEAGVPDIVGDSGTTIPCGNYWNGAFYAPAVATTRTAGSGSGFSWNSMYFAASLSDPQYGASDTVQPPATEMYLYHYVGDFNRQAVLANIGVTSENIGSTSFLNTPVGTIIWSMANSVPTGYLVCNGQAVGRLAYPELFSAIGTTYGNGDGDSTFNLPNLIGKFVEGNATAGIEHEAGLPNITGEFIPGVSSGLTLGFGNGVSASGSFASESRGTGQIMQNSSASAEQYKVTLDASLSNPIYGNSDTVQPPSLTAMPCIKAFDAVVNDGTVDVGELIDDVNTVINNGNTIINNSGKVTQVGTRTTTGDWTITGLTVGKPLFLCVGSTRTNSGYVQFRVTSGSDDGTTGNDTYTWSFGYNASSTWVTPPSTLIIPTASTVIIKVITMSNTETLRAYQ